MSSDKPPQGEGIFGGIISLFWNKKAAPTPNTTQPTVPNDASKSHDYLTWSDNAIKKCSELVVLLEDHSAPTSRLLTLMNEVDPLLQVEHEMSMVRCDNDDLHELSSSCGLYDGNSLLSLSSERFSFSMSSVCDSIA